MKLQINRTANTITFETTNGVRAKELSVMINTLEALFRIKGVNIKSYKVLTATSLSNFSNEYNIYIPSTKVDNILKAGRLPLYLLKEITTDTGNPGNLINIQYTIV